MKIVYCTYKDPLLLHVRSTACILEGERDCSLGVAPATLIAYCYNSDGGCGWLSNEGGGLLYEKRFWLWGCFMIKWRA